MNLTKLHQNNIEQSIKRLGSSFYYYDLDGLATHLKALNQVMTDTPGIKLWYALKANPLSAIIKVFRNCGFGIDVASLGEVDQVIRSGLTGDHLISTGPAKGPEFLKYLLQEKVQTIVCESTNQVKWLNQVAGDLGIRPRALIRVQLEWEEGKSVLGGNAITPFGEDQHTWESFSLSEFKNIDFIGIHAFQWGNILDVQKLKTIWWQIAEQAQNLASKINLNLEVLDLGGGIGIPYEEGMPSCSTQEITQTLSELKTAFNIPQVWMELGRYAVGPYGYYLTPVVDKKKVRGQDMLILEGGLNHMVRPALTQSYFPVKALNKSGNDKTAFNLHGPLCTALDFLGNHTLDSNVDVGDWLVFFQCGAYGMTESMPFFLCHQLPAEVIYYNGHLMTPRTPKKSEDWLV